ncbi:MAG TPA: hypothetical protein VFL59_03695 [Candidatus Nanopelagicales bacterium]|nr:hypothetical protein [Candidatus Nanopelagicales bacterium]
MVRPRATDDEPPFGESILGPTEQVGADAPRGRIGAWLDHALAGRPTPRHRRWPLLVVVAAIAAAAVVVSQQRPTTTPLLAVRLLSVHAYDGTGAPRLSVVLASPGPLWTDALAVVTVHGSSYSGGTASTPSGPSRQAWVAPRCGRLLEPATRAQDEELQVTVARPGSPAVEESVPAPGLRAAARAACWSSLAARSLSVHEVTTGPQDDGRWLGVRVGLASTAGVALHATAVDVADVDTIAPADRALVPAGGTAELTFRLPAADCASAVPYSIPLAIGPDAAPLVVVTVPMTEFQRSSVQAGRNAICARAPAPRVLLRSSRSGQTPWTSDAAARTIALELGVAVPDARGGTVQVGDMAATNDARPVLLGGQSELVSGRAVVTVLWSTYCTDRQVPSLVALRLDRAHGRRSWLAALPVEDLRRVRARACST